MSEENNNPAADQGAVPPQPPAPDATPAPQPPTPPAPQPPAPGAVPQPPTQPPAPGAPYAPPPGAASSFGAPQQPYAPGQPVDPYAQPAPASYQPAPSNGKAIGALVCGILAIVFSATIVPSIVLGIVAIVLASKAFKESGKDGKATGGKICGIAGIVLSVIALFVYIFLGIGLVVWASNHNDAVLGSSSLSASSDSSQNSADNAQAQEAASAQLDELANKDAATVQYLATSYDKLFKMQAGYSLTDLGVDPTEFAQWLLGDFSYSDVHVIAFDDGTGSASASVTMRDVSAFLSTFTSEIQSLVDSGAGGSMDMAAAKAKVGEIIKDAMAKTTETTDTIVTFDVVQKGDTWTVDDDTWKSELKYLFGLY